MTKGLRRPGPQAPNPDCWFGSCANRLFFGYKIEWGLGPSAPTAGGTVFDRLVIDRQTLYGTGRRAVVDAGIEHPSARGDLPWLPDAIYVE
jgi:hypothetical protein